MAPHTLPPCQICNKNEPKYTCSSCRTARYCSVACYKEHKETCAVSTSSGSQASSELSQATSAPTSDSLEDPPSLRPLTSLKWPYIPDDATYDDPLKRDDPKPLQLHHYEAIATSPAIRTLLKTNPGLRTFLTSIDKLRGTEREEALRLALGVDSRQLSSDDGWHLRSDAVRTQGNEIDEDTRAFKMLAEAIEAAVRDGRRDALGLDWDD